ncbi:MAG: LysM peptidoglycan-binding domain-containing protein [Tyzzerella sp.]|nr:LysM peptidoglycan-binding domain-containing protein [Tyzzerella sp.]
MTIQERKARANQKKRRQAAKRNMFILLATVLVITIGCIVFGNAFSAGKANASDETKYKYYKSIEIEKGDSLWTIAEEYNTDDSTSTKEYIDELMDLNNLTSKTIHEGQHLLVAYYDTEYR